MERVICRELEPAIRGRRSIFIGLICTLGLLSGIATAQDAEEDLADLSLEDLMNIEVTSVSKKKQSKFDAAAAITVITNDQIRRSGFTTVPEMLRLVPGFQVSRIDAHRWAISTRGFAGEFSNTLLVLVDGRSVYNPLFGGVYWDRLDYPIEDIERIEAIRGPGGAVWGDNAVNGVVNIITKKSKDTQGVLASVHEGSVGNSRTIRYGGKLLGDSTTFRIFGRRLEVEDFDVDQRGDGIDEWNRGRVGLRVDSDLSENDELVFTADYFDVDSDRGVAAFDGTDFSFAPRSDSALGGHAYLGWKHESEALGTFNTKTYYEQTHREDTTREDRRTADFDFQHDLKKIELRDSALSLDLSWGLNYRFSNSHIQGDAIQSLDPNSENYHIGGGFIQGQLNLWDERIALIGGVKLGGNSRSGFEYQPTGRLLVRPVHGHTLWVAASRAVRTPTQFERSIVANFPNPMGGPGIRIQGNRNSRSENLFSIEAGYRFFQIERLTTEVSFFWSDYKATTTFSLVDPTTLQLDNQGEVMTIGAEVEINLLPFDWWRLGLGYSVVKTDENFPPAIISGLGGFGPNASTPRHQIQLSTYFELPYDLEFDAHLYWVDGIDLVQDRFPPTTSNIEQYFRLDLRIGYKPYDWIEFALVGQNLLEKRHAEFNDVQRNLASEVPRSGYGKVTIQF